MSDTTEVPAPRAKRIQIVLAVLAVAATIAVGAFVWIDTAEGDAPAPAATDSAPGLSGGSLATSTPSVTPAPTATPDAPAPGDGEEQPLQDLTGPKSLAANSVAQYLTWDDAETPDARAARLAPFFAPDSPFLTGRPNSANPKYAEDESARVVTKVSGQVYPSPVSVTDAVANFKVVAQYESVQVADGYRYNYKGAATYEVTVPLNVTTDSRVIDFEDPRFMF